MSWFLLNILLGVMWMLFWGWFSIWSLLSGLVLGWVLLGVVSRVAGWRTYAARGVDILLFTLYFIRILIKSNLIVAWEVITPGFNMTPRFIRYSVQGLTDVQITTLANAITLTPGTLSVDISDEDDILYIHCMYAADRAAAVRDIDELRDKLMQKVFT
jgi:multicomponent Na+:H+ antiporter subunit E